MLTTFSLTASISYEVALPTIVRIAALIHMCRVFTRVRAHQSYDTTLQDQSLPIYGMNAIYVNKGSVTGNICAVIASARGLVKLWDGGTGPIWHLREVRHNSHHRGKT